MRFNAELGAVAFLQLFPFPSTTNICLFNRPQSLDTVHEAPVAEASLCRVCLVLLLQLIKVGKSKPVWSLGIVWYVG